MSAERRLRLSLSREDALDLQLGEHITLDGRIVVTAGLPTHRRLLVGIRAGEDPPIPLENQTFFHLGSYSREVEGGVEIVYMNPTTSTRFNAYMPEIIRHYKLRCIGGKGGLDAACADALRDVGGVYLSFLGGGAALFSRAIRRVVDVAYNDLISHYRLTAIEVEGLGPLTVAIDAHGNSLYEQLADGAAERRQAIVEQMNAARRTGGG